MSRDFCTHPMSNLSLHIHTCLAEAVEEDPGGYEWHLCLLDRRATESGMCYDNVRNLEKGAFEKGYLHKIVRN